MLQWFQQKWADFEAWINGVLPGIKTRLMLALGFLGNTAFVIKDYITGLPLEQFVNPTNLLIANMILFTLAYWFRGLGDRVDERE